ncbi:MAG TPA: DUF393 domain-containing protein [Marinagarivorans sp.]
MRDNFKQEQSKPAGSTATVYYDGQCSICAREIKHLEPRSSLAFVDIHGEAELPKSKHALLAELHVLGDEGPLMGFDANLYLWRMSGYEKRAQVCAAPVIYPIAKAVYEYWAKWRYRRRYRKCNSEQSL